MEYINKKLNHPASQIEKRHITIYTSSRTDIKFLMEQFHHWSYRMLTRGLITIKGVYYIEIIRLKSEVNEDVSKETLERELVAFQETVKRISWPNRSKSTNWVMEIKTQKLDQTLLEKISDIVGEGTIAADKINYKKNKTYFLGILKETYENIYNYILNNKKVSFSLEQYYLVLNISYNYKLNIIGKLKENAKRPYMYPGVEYLDYIDWAEKTNNKYKNNIEIFLSVEERIDFIREQFKNWKNTLSEVEKQEKLNIEIIRLADISYFPKNRITNFNKKLERILEREMKYDKIIQGELQKEIEPHWTLKVGVIETEEAYDGYNTPPGWKEKRWIVGNSLCFR